MSAPSVASEVPAAETPEPAKRPRRQIGSWLFTLVTLLAVAGVLYASFRQTKKVSASNPTPTASAKRGEFLVIVTCRGELVAGKSVAITAPTNVPDLRIIWMAPQGEQVKPGQPILKFDESSAKRQLQEKEATLRQNQASLDQAVAEARINNEKDKLELASAVLAVERAKLDVQKAEIVSALQAAEYKLELALAEEKRRVQDATIKLNEASAASKIASLTTQRDKAQAEVDLINKRISQMSVVAPSDGIVTYLMNYSQGWVNARPFKIGDQVWPGSALAEIPDLTTLEIKAKVEEMDRSRIEVGQKARIVLDPFPERHFPSSVIRVSPLTEQNFEWPPSRNFRAFGGFGESDSKLRPGMNGRLDVIISRIPDAISVPAKAVFTRNGKAIVLTPHEGGWKPIEVTVVARNPDEVAVRGISAGTTVALTDDLAKEKKKS